MKNTSLLFILLFLSATTYSQVAQEKTFSMILSCIGGAGFINYNFTNNNPYPNYYQPDHTSAVLLNIPIKINVLFHHQAFHIGGGLDRRDINIGVGVKRQSISGRYYDYLQDEDKNLNATLFKIYGRGELTIIEHERGGNRGGFAGFFEGGSLSVRHGVGVSASSGLCLGLGGLYFRQLTHNFFITVELATGYDRYKSYYNSGISTHNLFSNEIMAGVRVAL